VRSVLPTPSSPWSVSCSSGNRITSSWPSSRCSGRSTAATSTRRACWSAFRARVSACCRGPARTRAW